MQKVHNQRLKQKMNTRVNQKLSTTSSNVTEISMDVVNDHEEGTDLDPDAVETLPSPDEPAVVTVVGGTVRCQCHHHGQ